VPEAAVEEYVLVHVGFAISTVDRAEAERVFALLEQLGALDELDDDAGGGGPQP
jgi:hydrogenase expression/formation protein HypC